MIPVTIDDAIEAIKKDAIDRGHTLQLRDAMWLGAAVNARDLWDLELTWLREFQIEWALLRMCRLVRS